MSAHNPIEAHPEYVRSYEHFLMHVEPDEAARLAYEHVQGKLATGALAPVPPRRSPVTLIAGFGVFALLAVCGTGGVAGALSGTSTEADVTSGGLARVVPAATGPARASAAAAPPRRRAVKRAAPGIGAAVRDGKFEFVVRRVSCGRRQVGSGYLIKRAQGRFCLVNVTVRNIGDRSQNFDSVSQRAFNAQHQEYSVDGAAEFYANNGNETFLNAINPGNSVERTLVFDIPAHQSLVTAKLTDSMFSGGVTVRLK